MNDLDAIRADALSAYKRAIRWVFETTYVGGQRTIKRRAPDDFTFHLSSFYSWNYGAAAGCSVAAARAHLRKLVARGEVIEHERCVNSVRFKMPRAVHDKVGAQIIEELVAEGLPFDDDYMRSRRAAA